MCGFFGEITSNLLSDFEFKKILNLSIHRGPDQQGISKSNDFQIGFNRLAILDLSENGNQPLFSPNKRFVVVFNGEIYNYKELQKLHQINDNELRSKTDSEILVHLLEKMSVQQVIKHLNGMFAISVYDILEKKAYLARDFAGIKPLFYGFFEDGLVFASQFDQVFQYPAFNDKKLRPEIMKEYFGLGYMHAPNTVFENIYQVAAGEVVCWDFETKKIVYKSSYFDFISTNENEETNPETSELFEQLFDDVISQQLNADVPIATFLSSGVDSTLVTSFAKKNKNDITAFTFGVNQEQLNEAPAAVKIAKQIEVNHKVFYSNEQELLSNIDTHFNFLSEPFGDYSSIPTFLITKEAKKIATVMLSGDGGDELFWGYPRFLKSVQQAHWFNYPLWLRKLLVPFFRKINPKLSNALDILPSFSSWILYKQNHFHLLEELFPNQQFSKELLEDYAIDSNQNKTQILMYLKQNEFKAHLQRVLKKVDLMSMANSLEVRVPFLDNSIINFSNSINPKYGIEHQETKFVLKQTLHKIMPSIATSTSKKGFTVPIADWLKNELKADFIKTVLETPIFGAEHIDTSIIKNEVEKFYKNQKSVNPWGLWHVYAWQKWALKYNLIATIE